MAVRERDILQEKKKTPFEICPVCGEHATARESETGEIRRRLRVWKGKNNNEEGRK